MEAKRIGEEAALEMLDGNYDDALVFECHSYWSTYFLDVAWDYAFVVINPGKRIVHTLPRHGHRLEDTFQQALTDPVFPSIRINGFQVQCSFPIENSPGGLFDSNGGSLSQSREGFELSSLSHGFS